MRSRLPHIGAIMNNNLTYYWLDKNHFGKVRFSKDFAKIEKGFVHVADTNLNNGNDSKIGRAHV